jgi:hypothetical protein
MSPCRAWNSLARIRTATRWPGAGGALHGYGCTIAPLSLAAMPSLDEQLPMYVYILLIEEEAMRFLYVST